MTRGFPRQFVLTGNLFNRKRRDMMEKETTWQRWVKGMGKMKEEVKEHFSQLWSKKETGEKDWEELEELLIQADMGPALSLEIVEEFREFKKSREEMTGRNGYIKNCSLFWREMIPLFLLLLKKEN